MQAVEAAAETATKAQMTFPPFIPELVSEIGDSTALSMASRMQRAAVDVAGRSIGTAYVGPSEEDLKSYPSNSPVMVMLHGFDSSSLEHRRLHPLLSKHTPTYAVDLVGWGFTDHTPYQANPDLEVSPNLKRQHLKGFIEQVVKAQCGDRPVIVLGTSLGGAIAIDFAIHHPELCSRLALIAPQAFIDGIGPMSTMPKFLATLGVKVLRAEWLRQAANQVSYFNKDAMATRDALLVGRLHTHLPGWQEANVAYMQSGGYSISQRLPEVQVPALVMWGRNDEVLDPKLYADKVSNIPTARLLWVEKCGHVPHLEHPEFVARTLVEEEMKLKWIE